MTNRSWGDAVRGRTAVVTGGGNGLGRAIALALGAAGARVLLVGRTAETMDSVLRELALDGVQADAIVCDVTDALAVDRLRTRLEAESVSILVNNAGIGGPVADLVDVRAEDWDDVFAANVRGVFLMCKTVLPGMIERQGGDIVNLASVTGKRPLRGRTPYAASKMAVIGLTATLAWEVGPAGVNVNSLSPGPVDGPRMNRNFAMEAQRTGRSYEEAEHEYVSRGALHRLLTEEEVANAVLAILNMPGLAGADIDLSAGMIAR